MSGHGLGGLAMRMLLFLIQIGGCWHTVGSESRGVFWFGGCCAFGVGFGVHRMGSLGSFLVAGAPVW